MLPEMLQTATHTNASRYCSVDKDATVRERLYQHICQVDHKLTLKSDNLSFIPDFVTIV